MWDSDQNTSDMRVGKKRRLTHCQEINNVSFMNQYNINRTQGSWQYDHILSITKWCSTISLYLYNLQSQV